MKTKHKIARTYFGGYNYRGYVVIGKSGSWLMVNSDGYIAHSFITLKEFMRFINKNYKMLSKYS